MRVKAITNMCKLVVSIFIMNCLLYASLPCFAYEEEVNKLSQQIAKQIKEAERKSVAVVDFTDLSGNVTELGRFLAEEVSIVISQEASKKFEVIDRTRIKLLLKEQRLATTGLIDPATAKELGKIAGVDTLVTGIITPTSDTIRLSIKALDVSTANTIGTAVGNIPRTKTIEELLSQGIAQGDSDSSSGVSPSTSLLANATLLFQDIFNQNFDARDYSWVGKDNKQQHFTDRGLELYGGNWADLWTDNNAAAVFSRLILDQPNMLFQFKVSGNPTMNYQQIGLIVMKDADNYIRLMSGYWGDRLNAGWAMENNLNYEGKGDLPISAREIQEGVELELIRKGNTFSAYLIRNAKRFKIGDCVFPNFPNDYYVGFAVLASPEPIWMNVHYLKAYKISEK